MQLSGRAIPKRTTHPLLVHGTSTSQSRETSHRPFTCRPQARTASTQRAMLHYVALSVWARSTSSGVDGSRDRSGTCETSTAEWTIGILTCNSLFAHYTPGEYIHCWPAEVTGPLVHASTDGIPQTAAFLIYGRKDDQA